MTITYHDGFAIKPKKCDKCGRVFWLEFYDYDYSSRYGINRSIKEYVCKKCVKKVE